MADHKKVPWEDVGCNIAPVNAQMTEKRPREPDGALNHRSMPGPRPMPKLESLCDN